MSKTHEEIFHQRRKMANKHMKRYSSPLAIQRIQNEPQDIITTHRSKWEK